MAVDGAALPEDERRRRLLAHQQLIRGCTRCVAAGLISQARPVFHGDAAARVMIVGQAPALPRAERPLPYSGASGKVLRAWLARAGFDAERFYEAFYLTSLTKCFPGPSRSGKGDRAPSAAEIANCADHLAGELALVRPEVILPLGKLAAGAFVASARRRRLDELIGRRFAYQDAIVLPLPHPSGVSRWLNAPANRVLLDAALAELRLLREELGL
ncbi:MAG TPA: uracil-DNA glycosylase family protein [Thermomicrobiaceae bacterium]|nr:uracil-DNA glycosylase family protein [Thermomicrobiaceae bacterium]